MNRRSLLRTGSITVLAAPILVLHELTKPPRDQLPHVQAGQIMTAGSWNLLVDRVNLLSNQ